MLPTPRRFHCSSLPPAGDVAGRGDPAHPRSPGWVATQDQRLLRRRSRWRARRSSPVRAAVAARRGGRAARRRGGDDQGSDADARLPDFARVAPRRSRPGLVGGFAGDRAIARSRCCHPRQDDDPGIRLEGPGRQPADRDHPQPVGPLAHARRQQCRRRNGLHRRDRPLASRPAMAPGRSAFLARFPASSG